MGEPFRGVYLLVLLVTAGFGLIGFLDDYRKLAVRIPGRARKSGWPEIMVALFVGVVLYFAGVQRAGDDSLL